MHDLLSEPLIGVITPEGPQRLSLPELLAALSAGRVTSYTGLRAHQADPWHVFLVQLAASIQARAPTETLPTDATYWRDGLWALADGQASAWHLVEEDVTKVAFLQHPWRSWEEDAADYGIKSARGKTVLEPKARTPDELDVLVTSKNHDVKMSRMDAQVIEAWFFALVLVQTTSGVYGQGNYGIVRMNGGYGTRSIVSWASSPNPARRFQDEVTALKGLRGSIRQAFHYRERGTVLTWLTSWDRTTHQYTLTDLEPWFIEAVRPVRLRVVEGRGIVALGATSQARQIGPKNLDNGDVGDPWTPINVSDKKKGRSALTLLSADGFTPQRLTDLLFQQGFELTPLQTPPPGEGPGWFLASGLARGQGKTEGLHQAALPVPPKARLALLRKESRETLGAFAQKLLTDANEVERALSAALVVLSEGGPENADFNRDAVKRWIDGMRARFAKTWEASYFPMLWRGVEESHETVRHDWQQELVNKAAALLDEASQRLPIPANRTWRAVTRANSAFRGVLTKQSLPLPGPEHRFTLDVEETTV
jgi:CRISPR system Cascade subunit CasA